MANLNPLEPGDVPYPQYSVTTTMPLEAGNTFVKGRLYTVSSAGLLHQVAGFETGLFQARETPTINVPALAGDKLQVLGQRTRMIFTTTEAGLHVGDDVDGAVNSDAVVTSVGVTNFVGKIFEIYTKDAAGTTKLVTESGDKVIVETVGP